jgi:hypothetical protein
MKKDIKKERESSQLNSEEVLFQAASSFYYLEDSEEKELSS